MNLDTEFDLNSSFKEVDKDKSNYPNGIGMSIEEVKYLIAKQNEVIIDKDDPILLTVTILNAFLAEQEKQEDKYLKALKAVYAEQVKDYIKQVNRQSEEVKESLKSVSTEGILALYEKQTKKMTELQSQLRSSCIIIAILVLADILVRFLK